MKKYLLQFAAVLVVSVLFFSTAASAAIQEQDVEEDVGVEQDFGEPRVLFKKIELHPRLLRLRNAPSTRVLKFKTYYTYFGPEDDFGNVARPAQPIVNTIYCKAGELIGQGENPRFEYDRQEMIPYTGALPIRNGKSFVETTFIPLDSFALIKLRREGVRCDLNPSFLANWDFANLDGPLWAAALRGAGFAPLTWSVHLQRNRLRLVNPVGD